MRQAGMEWHDCNILYIFMEWICERARRAQRDAVARRGGGTGEGAYHSPGRCHSARAYYTAPPATQRYMSASHRRSQRHSLRRVVLSTATRPPRCTSTPPHSHTWGAGCFSTPWEVGSRNTPVRFLCLPSTRQALGAYPVLHSGLD